MRSESIGFRPLDVPLCETGVIMLRFGVVFRRRAAAVALSLFLPTLATGQTSRTSGSVLGTVVDQTGSAVPAARIQLTNPATNQARTAASGPTGDIPVDGVP